MNKKQKSLTQILKKGWKLKVSQFIACDGVLQTLWIQLAWGSVPHWQYSPCVVTPSMAHESNAVHDCMGLQLEASSLDALHVHLTLIFFSFDYFKYMLSPLLKMNTNVSY